MIGSTFGVCKIDFRGLKLIFICLVIFEYNWFSIYNWFWLEIRICSMSLELIISFGLIIQLTFTQTYININYFTFNLFLVKINFCYHSTKHTRNYVWLQFWRSQTNFRLYFYILVIPSRIDFPSRIDYNSKLEFVVFDYRIDC